MRIIDKRAPMNKYEFKDIEVGSVFFIEQELFMKIPHVIDVDEIEINAINLQTFEYENIGYAEWCLPVQADITIDYLR